MPFHFGGKVIDIDEGVAVPLFMIGIDFLGETVVVQQQFFVGHASYGFLLFAIDILKIFSIFGIAVTHCKYDTFVPQAVQIIGLLKPFKAYSIASEVCLMAHVHGAESVTSQVDKKPEGIDIVWFTAQQVDDAVHCPEEIAALGGIMRQSGQNYRVRKP